MLLFGRRLTSRCTLFGLALTVASLSGCADDTATSSSATLSSSTTTTTTTTTATTITTTTTTTPTTTDPTTSTTTDPSGSGSGGGTTGVLPDPEPCAPKFCIDASSCCENPNHPGNGGCPNGPYPNNWACVNSQCMHGGCMGDADCIVPGFACLMVDDVGRCVAPCDDDNDCTAIHNMEKTLCIGVSATSNFCLENIPAP